MIGRKTLLRAAGEVSRHHLSLFALLTLVNFVLIKAGVNVFIPFSAVFPQFVMAYADIEGHGIVQASALADIIALLCVCLFALCVVFSYRKPGWLLCGTSLTAADAAFVLYLTIRYGGSGFNAALAFDAWIIIVLCAGYLAPKLLGSGRGSAPAKKVCADNVADTGIPPDSESKSENETPNR